MNRQIVNQRQQPSERHYNRDRETYYRDEERDFYNGADYLPERRRYAGESGHSYNSPNNVWQQRHQDQREYSDRLYTPSFDYGYRRDEYYPMDPSRSGHETGEASGYGNDRSVQGRDFENWLHGEGQYSDRNYRPHSPTGNYDRDNIDHYNYRGNEENAYNYGEDDRHHEDEDRRRGIFSWFRRKPRHRHYDPYHNRNDRHPEIVVPFKDEEYYSQNDYNHSEGFGNNEMVFHDEPRRRGRRGW